MTFASLREKMKQFDKNAEVIFDQQEPVGTPTDVVMPRRRWFHKRNDRSIGPKSPIRPILP